MRQRSVGPKILGVLSGFVYIFLWAPVFVIILFSFSSNKFGVKWDEFTLRWYGELFTNEAVSGALIRSLIIASVTVVVSSLIGTITAYGLFKLHFKGKQFLRTSILLPIVFPAVVTGPIVEEIAGEYEGKATICKLNTDDARDSAMEFGISAIPTLILFKGGQVEKKWVGLTSKKDLAAAIDELL